MRPLTPALLVAIGLSTTACVSLPIYPFVTEEDAAGLRGFHYAQDNCAGCHQIRYEGASKNPRAPSFGQIHRSFSRTGLESELDAITEVGHFGMAPRPISPTDRSDVATYIENLRRP